MNMKLSALFLMLGMLWVGSANAQSTKIATPNWNPPNADSIQTLIGNWKTVIDQNVADTKVGSGCFVHLQVIGKSYATGIVKVQASPECVPTPDAPLSSMIDEAKASIVCYRGLNYGTGEYLLMCNGTTNSGLILVLTREDSGMAHLQIDTGNQSIINYAPLVGAGPN